MFSANHQRTLLTRLCHLDESLTEALQRLEPQDDGQLYRRLTPDATGEQRRVLRDYLGQLRFVMRRFIQAQQLSDETRPISGLKSFNVALVFAQSAAEELRPSYLRGYGVLDAASAEALEQLAAELQTLLRRMSGYLARGEGGGLAGRLALLEQTPEEAGLLRELDRIIADHGLVELRTPLQTLVERLAAPRFEIAIFGRVSAGKSSLLNWWLEREVLPTGVTPVTAVPTRIVYGEPAQARVTTAAVSGRVLPIDEVSHYITEASNPGNREGVLEIVIQVPAPRLGARLMLVDTPGLGSLASAGAVQTLEYLPRCDLGILLVEAGGVITREDLEVARALVDSGSELVVALSKVDRLSSVELAQSRAYATEQFGTALGIPVDIGEISTVGSESAQAARWFEQVLSPRIASVQVHAAAGSRRKIGALRETVMAVLEARLEADRRSQPATSSASATSAATETLSAARARIRRARESLLTLTGQVPKCAVDLLTVAAKALETCWHEGTQEAAAVASSIEDAFAKLAAEIGDIVSEPLGEVRRELQQVLSQRKVSHSAEDLPSPRGRPMFDAAFVARQADIHPPHGLQGVGPLLKRTARRAAERALRGLIEEQLSLYAQALRVWALRSLEEMASRFDAMVAAEESTLRITSNDTPGPISPEQVQGDLLRLRDWPRRAPEREAAQGAAPSVE